MKSRFWIHGRESSAALALENSSGLTPRGALGVAMVAGWGGIGAGACGNSVGDRICELAAPDSNRPPAPAAPRRNISLRFNDIHTLRFDEPYRLQQVNRR